MAAPSKVWVCDRSFAGIAGSYPTRGMVVCLLFALCVVRKNFLLRADHPSKGVLPSVVRLTVIVKPL